jgi:hypothetical protein
VVRIRIWLAFFSLCMITAVLLSGCLGFKTPQISSQVPPNVFVDYQRTGGIAGVNDRLVIFDNGVTVISSRKVNTEITLNQTELERIGNLFSDNKFQTLEGNYTSRRGGADFMQYTLSFRGKTVHTDDTAIPPALRPILDEMDRILILGMGSGKTGSPLPRMTQ